MSRGDSRSGAGLRQAAVDGVAAYLAEEDADVYNITDAAVREDALTAALDLTALAASAVTVLAATVDRSPDEVLRSLQHRGIGELPRQPDPARPGPPANAQVIYPAPMDEHDWAMTETKGWIEVTVHWAGGEQTVTFYDPVRLAQTVQTVLAQSGRFAERAVVVVPRLTRDAIESAVAAMAKAGFVEVR